MTDHYATLGVARTASDDEIKQAYRRLASQHHPDKGGSTEKFQAIQAAYAVLGDAQKRAEYDNPQPQNLNMGFGAHGFDFGSFMNMFNQGMGQTHSRRNHVRTTIWISLRDVAQGGRRTISMGTAQGVTAVDVEIPQGIDDGDNVQYPALGPGGTDLVITFRVQPDTAWQRQGLNLITERRVVIWDLIVGGSISVTDLLGTALTVQVPPGTQPGTLLRLRQRGLRDRQGQQGDLFVRVAPYLPTQIPEDIRDAIKKHHQ